jgi:hypothetical protein
MVGAHRHQSSRGEQRKAFTSKDPGDSNRPKAALQQKGRALFVEAADSAI